MADKTPKTAPEAAPATGTQVISNNRFELVDNTDAAAEIENPATATEVPLLGDFVQVNYV